MTDHPGWSPEKSVSFSRVMDAVKALAQDYMTYFDVGHVTPHIMRCLMEVVCPNVSSDAKRAAMERIMILNASAKPQHAADILRPLLRIFAVHTEEAMRCCTEEQERVRIQTARRPKHSRIGLHENENFTKIMEEPESRDIQNVRALQESQKLLTACEERLRVVEEELCRVRPDYYSSEKLSESNMGQFLMGTKMFQESSPAPDENTVKLSDKSKSATMRNESKYGVPKLPLADATNSIVTGYTPSRAFVLQAARQLYAESRNTRKHTINESLGVKDEQIEGPITLPSQSQTSKSHPSECFPSNFSLRKDPLRHLRFLYHPNPDGCDTLPPTTELISSEALCALMNDKRPLRVQQEERETKEKEWCPLGKQRLSYAEPLTGPTAYSRYSGISAVVQMEKEMTRRIWYQYDQNRMK